jgi:hypothetical protein
MMPSPILTISILDSVISAAQSAHYFKTASMQQQACHTILHGFLEAESQSTRMGIASDAQARANIIHITQTMMTQVVEANTEATAWRTCARNFEMHLIHGRGLGLTDSRLWDTSFCTIISLIPVKILEAIYTTTFSHLTVSEHSALPFTTGINWYSETNLQGRAKYRNPLIGLSYQDIDYSVPDPVRVERFAEMSVLGLIAVLAQNEHWEWEAYLELHRRAVIDWMICGPNRDFPHGGFYERRIEHNRELLAGYDWKWGIEQVEGKTVAMVPDSDSGIEVVM